MGLRPGLLVLLAASLVAFVGCGKSRESKPAPPPGAIDIGSLQQAFPTPPPEVTSCIEKLRYAARYRQFGPALAELNKLAQLPTLTGPQKHAVSNVIEQVKVASQTGPPTPSR